MDDPEAVVVPDPLLREQVLTLLQAQSPEKSYNRYGCLTSQ